MPDTPNYALPFPTLQDVPNAPGDLQALAEQIDGVLLAELTGTGLVSREIKSGTSIVTPDGSGLAAIVFGTPFASGTPHCFAVLGDAGTPNEIKVIFSMVSASQMGVGLYLADGNPQVGGSHRVNWFAIGNR